MSTIAERHTILHFRLKETAMNTCQECLLETTVCPTCHKCPDCCGCADEQDWQRVLEALEDAQFAASLKAAFAEDDKLERMVKEWRDAESNTR